MSRSRQPVRPPRGRAPILVVIVLILRGVVFMAGIGLAAALLRDGHDLLSVSGSVSTLIAACAAAGSVLTGRVCADRPGRG